MAILSKGNTFATGDQVTALKLNNLVDNSTFASGAVDDSTTQLNGSGQIIVKDGGVVPSKLSTGGPAWTTGGQVKLINSKSDISDFWGSGDNGAAVFTPYGFFGSNGSFGLTLVSNGYRNSSGGFTSLGVNSQSNTSILELLPTGVTVFRNGSPSGTSAPESMRIAANGEVGIGTDNPNGNLHVVGATGDAGRIYVSDKDNGEGASDALLIAKSGTSAFVYNRDNGDLRLGSNDNNDHVTINSAGNVGIGKTSPDTAIHIENTSENQITLTNNSGNFSRIRSERGLVLAADFDTDSGTGQSFMAFETDNVERMRITANGSVILSSLPTSASGLASGAIYSDSGTLKIVS